MPTCPDCGSVVMEGDPYCQHCGAHLRWSGDETAILSNSKLEEVILNDIIASRQQKMNLLNKISELLDSKGTSLKAVTTDIDKAYFIFERKNMYLTTTVSCLFRFHSSGPGVFESYEITSDYSNILNDQRFQKSVRDVEDNISKRFSHLTGGFEVKDSPLGDFTFLNEYNVSAFFKNSQGGGVTQYFLNLETMKLTGAFDSLLEELKRLTKGG